ncbi:MAG: type II toxin-antitoxin system PemK/MazF family toxin [Candidatus Fibromonas sp.]|jgi:mRNA interferase MazF|nr:type II toxin-antitoxin system PemK/MazF family toxin [Candidatus Fibromonas sp.]
MKRFDIYTTTGGTYSTKPRPAVIIQALAFDDFDSLTVIPMTTIEVNSDFRIRIEPSQENNLGKTGFVMIDKLTTIKKSGLGEYIGHIEDKYIDEIEDALLKFIGIA